MARGWESKDVEAQRDAAQTEREQRAKAPLTPVERERNARREGLLLSRSRIVNSIEAARDERYRKQLERALEHLDAEIREYETGD